MTEWLVMLSVLLVALFFSAFFSGSETGLYCVNRVRIHLGAQHGNVQAMRVAKLLDDRHSILSVVLVGTNVANYVATAAVTYMFTHMLEFSDREAEVYTVAALTPVVFVFGEVVPKNLFQLNADALMARGSAILLFAYRLMRYTGVVWLLAMLSRGAMLLIGSSATPAVFEPKRRITVMLREALVGHRGGREQIELVERVSRLSDIRVHEIMVPANRIVAIDDDADRKELVSIARRVGFSRLPVMDRRSRRMIGVVKVDELLRRIDWNIVADGMSPVTFLGPHDTLTEAIARMRKSSSGLAVVADRGGKALGLISLKDLLQQVVGELPAW